MVAAVRAGQSLRAVARRFGVGVATVAHWVERAKGQRLDRVDWSDRSSAPHQTRRTDALLEDLVLQARRDLAQSDLGAIGADAIRQRAAWTRASPRCPRCGPSTASSAAGGPWTAARGRAGPLRPQAGICPTVARAEAELDSIDIVEGLVIKDGPHVEVLNVVSLHGGLVASWPVEAPVTSVLTVAVAGRSTGARSACPATPSSTTT